MLSVRLDPGCQLCLDHIQSHARETGAGDMRGLKEGKGAEEDPSARTHQCSRSA
jgi:hypothetical protein